MESGRDVPGRSTHLFRQGADFEHSPDGQLHTQDRRWLVVNVYKLFKLRLLKNYFLRLINNYGLVFEVVIDLPSIFMFFLICSSIAKL